MTAPRILVFVPMFNCERQITRVLRRIRQHLLTRVHEVLVVDNGSGDRSCEVATAALAGLGIPGTLLQNEGNFNLGGSHKVAFAYAIAGGFDWVVVVHGDDQAEPSDLLPLLAAGALHAGVDALLGSRFSRGAQRIGYAWHRTCGNRAFNLLFTLASARRVADLGAGLNAFRVGWLREATWLNLADDLTFNIHLLLRLVHSRARFRFFPITWREEDQVSNVRLLRQAWRTLGIAWGYFWRRGAYLQRGHAVHAPQAYRARERFANRQRQTAAGGSSAAV
jgi:glycosyltransferase involved in cell wall biosynthesis